MVRRGALGLDAHVGLLDIELGDRVQDLVTRKGGVLERVPECGRRIDGREDLAPRRFDVRLEPLDFPMRPLVRVGLGRERGRRAIALGVGFGRCFSPGGNRRPRGLAARLEGVPLAGHDRDALLEALDLLSTERDLLLLSVDGELSRVRRLAGARRA